MIGAIAVKPTANIRRSVLSARRAARRTPSGDAINAAVDAATITSKCNSTECDGGGDGDETTGDVDAVACH